MGTSFIISERYIIDQSVLRSILQLGTAFGATVTTVVFNQVTLHGSMIPVMANPQPKLDSYRAAQWTAFAFGVLGKIFRLSA